ncbi:tyrosine-type recombinase/integrase [Deefgea tanakiae]|uniref:Tyrosine-type recombinase/integrase n=1 Tax=Deefgea tanakiae TaxID=2865840 RepID=A0ABX8Z7U8_9NEIS|nr:site-specific integrase [Deefgea tanakiae]QZA78654.1 tyrosine-type recombinase/integrase [Deefgea tanakiae]
MAIKKLTTKEIDNAKVADGKTETILRDGDGLEFRVTASGRYWQMRYQFAGRRRVLSINEDERERDGEAKPDEHRLSTARRWRGWCRLQLAKGIDPAQARQDLAAADQQLILDQQHQQKLAELERETKAAEAALHAARMTFSELFNRWERVQLSNRKDQGSETRRSFQKDVFPLLGNLYADEINRQHIARVLHDIVERGAKRMANHTLSDLRQCFGYAIGAGLLENDPTSHLKKTSFGGNSIERDRVLSESELRYLLQTALPNCKLSFKYQAAIRVLLGTAARIGELLRAQRSHIDLTTRTWFIPADNAKNGISHLIYLSDFAMSGFNEIFSLLEHPEWLFMDRRGESHVCVKTLTKQISDRQTNTAMSGRSQNTQALVLSGGKWTPHDLRRTAATLMGELGVAPHVIEKCLNHKEKDKVIRTYQLQRLEAEQREAFILLGERLALLANTEADNVILLNRHTA